MLSKYAALLFLLAIGFHAAALTLQPIPAAKNDPLPITTGQPPIACDQIIDRMLKYQQMVSAQESSLTSFLNDVSTKIGGWYSVLSPLEGTQQTLPLGTFAPLQDGADKIGTLANMAFDNTDLLTGELEHIVESLRACSLARVPVQ